MRTRCVWVVVAVVVLSTVSASAGSDLEFTPKGQPLAGVGPVGSAVVSRGDPFVLIADHMGNNVRMHRLDRRTGALVPTDSVAVNRPAALATFPAGAQGARFVLVSSLTDSTVTMFRLDARNGRLMPTGPSVPSGGSGPIAMDATSDGVVIVANKDSDSLGVLRLNLRTGALVNVGTHPAGDGPTAIRVRGNLAVVGHANSNDLHLYGIRRHGELYFIDDAPAGDRITAVEMDNTRRTVLASTFNTGELLRFAVGKGGLHPTDRFPTGGDITDMAVHPTGRVFVAGITPARVAAFDISRGQFQSRGSLAMSGLSSRTLGTVSRGRTTFVIVNEFNNNQTVVLEVR